MDNTSMGNFWTVTVLSALGLILLTGVGQALAGGPAPAQQALSAAGEMLISPSDRCPVCAMFPARHPHAAAALTLISGETYYFCGNGCLLRTWLRPTVYLGRPPSDIDRLVVRDYFSGKAIDGHTASWVAGSDVTGPMGPAIVALENAQELTVFKSRHGGKTVFTIDQLDDELWGRISRRKLPQASIK
mgnify:CR=1 FL=1